MLQKPVKQPLECSVKEAALKVFVNSTGKHLPVNTSTLNQRWNNVAHQRSSTLFQLWKNIERIMSIQCRWTNVVSTLIFGWKWKLSQHMFIGVASTLRKQHWRNFSYCCGDAHKKLAQKQSKTKVTNRPWPNRDK